MHQLNVLVTCKCYPLSQMGQIYLYVNPMQVQDGVTLYIRVVLLHVIALKQGMHDYS